MGSQSDTVKLQDSGGSSAQGSRPHQQDQYTILTNNEISSRNGDNLVFFAVYDGHGSKKIAGHANQNLQQFLMDSPEVWAENYEKAIRIAVGKEEDRLMERYNAGDKRFAISGSTLALCLINLTRGVFVVGGLGDSAVILAEMDHTGQKVKSVDRITRSHKPGSPGEKSRIEGAGGAVNNVTDTPRIGGLNLSRALGDFQYKQPLNEIPGGPELKGQLRTSTPPQGTRKDFVSSEPTVTQGQLSGQGRYILTLASDGVTNVMDDESMMDGILRCRSHGLGAKQIAKRIVTDAADNPGSDNATCINVFMDGGRG